MYIKAPLATWFRYSRLGVSSTSTSTSCPVLVFSTNLLSPHATLEGTKMSVEFCVKSMLLFFVVGLVAATENYMDYGEDTDKAPSENVHELYRLLLQRNTLETDGYGGIPFEHLMIRKSQRSPSLRLRFGRSDSHMGQIGQMLQRPAAGVATGFDENN